MLNILRRKAQPHYTPLLPFDTPEPSRAIDGIKSSYGGLPYNLTYGNVSGTIGQNRDLAPGDHGAALAAVIIETVYACVSARVQALDGMDWQIKQLRGNTPQDDDPILSTRQDVIPTHPYARALRLFHVNYKFSLFHAWYYSLLVTGKAFIQPLPSKGKGFAGLEWYNPLGMNIQAPLGEILYYQYNGKGETLNFKPEEIVYDRYLNLIDEIEGQSPIEVMMDSLNIERNMNRALQSYFRNNMKLGAIISPKDKGVFNDETLQRIARELSDNHIGVDQGYRNLATSIPMDITYPDQPELRGNEPTYERISKRVHQALRTPANVTGDMTATRYKENKDQYDAWMALTVLPDARNIRDVVNFHLMPLFDPTGQTYFTFDETEWNSRVTERDVEIREAARADLDAGAITLRQYNDRLDIAMDEAEAQELDVRFLPMDKQIVRRGEMPASNIPPAPIAPDPTPGIVPSINLPTDQKVTQDACVLLSLSNSPDLMALRQRVAEHLQDSTIEWNKPDTYHITLAYMPMVSEEQVNQLAAALEGMDLPELDLNVGSLNAFDDMGRYAVHFRLRKNSGLLDFQSDIVDACQELGIPLSVYSQPANYKPHITLGYTTTKPRAVPFHSKVMVSPATLQLSTSREDGTDEVVYETDNPNAPTVEPVATQDDAKQELKAWRKFASKPQTRTFEIIHLRGDVEYMVKLLLSEGVGVDDTFNQALKRLESVKAIQATRIDFETAIAAVITEARNGKLTRVRFGTILRNLISRYGQIAYRDGLVDSGIESGLPSEDEQAEISALISRQSAFVTDFGDQLYKQGGITDAEAANKPIQWFSGSINPFYQAAITSAKGNTMQEWVLGKTETHCADCLRLNGQRHRRKDYAKRNLIAGTIGQATECGQGGFCDCRLVDSPGREKGSW
jgi:2'-5' RNA ligase